MNTHKRMLLDTCILSQFAYKNPPRQLITWIKGFPEIYFAISISTVIEIQKGIENLRSCGSARADALEEWLDQLLASDLMCLDHDAKTARIIGRMLSIPALKALWIPDPKSKKPKLGQDLQIAAASIRYGIPVATANVSDFLQINEWFKLPGLCNPITDTWYVSNFGSNTTA
ncbi:hypothetical protein IR196_05735 [Brucella anthropi]|uniref:hypothetical protein n=1 Tax=Brucella anthropi TaxID=529 RepID=UPI00188BF30F|nr:hypothetical protein [Brucella anthropi]QPA25595.1 hypothetical protein IR196_05735 [Brucella anthropi]